MSNALDIAATAVVEATKVAAKQIGNYASTVFGPASEEFGALMAREVRLWKAMNLLKHVEKLQQVLKERGLRPEQARHLGYSEAVPLIEAASYEESDEVHGLWAGLLASALDPATDVRIEKAFVSILKEIGPVEAQLLLFVREYGGSGPSVIEGEPAVRMWEAYSASLASVPPDLLGAAIVNLRRLGCLEPNWIEPDVAWPSEAPDALGSATKGGFNDSYFAMCDLMELMAQGMFSADTHGGPMLRLEGKDGDWKEFVDAAALRLTVLGHRLMGAIENRPDRHEEGQTSSTSQG